jgi:drug/metabolite transporter (DMT)-like permease
MLYISATIVISVFLLILFKLFTVYNVNSFVAIIVNYIAACITGILFLDIPFNFTLFSSNWLPVAIPLGALFIFIFYLISQTAQKISIATASVANKMSVVIPVLFSVLYLREPFSLLKTFGVILALIAVYLSSQKNASASWSKKLLWLPALVFIGSGAIDTTLNLANSFLIKTKNDSALFTICTFMSAFCFGMLALGYQFLTQKTKLNEAMNLKNIVGGLLLGIPNYFSIYFIFKSLETNLLSSAQLFPVLNLCNVALAAITGWLIFKEKLSITNVTGIVLALISIIIISL